MESFVSPERNHLQTKLILKSAFQNNSDDTRVGFDHTHWSIVLPAAGQNVPEAQAALEQLCKIYWPPLYAFLRRQGRDSEDAKDLTQGFFAHLLSGNRLGNVSPGMGKFRSFLLACLKNYVQNERNKQNAEKRGGRHIHFPLNTSEAETNLGFEPSDPQDPARIYERKWATVLLQWVLGQLQKKYGAAGKGEFFEVLQPFIVGDARRGDYAGAAARLKLSDGAIRVAAARLREEFRLLLRSEVGRTVETESEIDDEIRHLLTAIRNS